MKNDCGEKQKKPDRGESFPGFKFPVDFIFWRNSRVIILGLEH